MSLCQSSYDWMLEIMSTPFYRILAVSWEGFDVVEGAEAKINAVWIGLKAFENTYPSLGFQNHKQ